MLTAMKLVATGAIVVTLIGAGGGCGSDGGGDTDDAGSSTGERSEVDPKDLRLSKNQKGGGKK